MPYIAIQTHLLRHNPATTAFQILSRRRFSIGRSFRVLLAVTRHIETQPFRKRIPTGGRVIGAGSKRAAFELKQMCSYLSLRGTL